MNNANYLLLPYPKEASRSTSLDTLTISEHRYITLYCANCGYPYKVLIRCGDRTCPECRSRDYFRIFPMFKTFLATKFRLRLITLTLRYRKDILLKERVIRLRASFKKLLRQYRSEMTGGFYSIEAKKTEEGWNVHLHILAEGKFIPQKALSDSWLAITGDSPIVDIRACWSAVSGFKYILKYLLKPAEVGDCKDEYNEAFARVRMVSAFGNWYKFNKEYQKINKQVPPPCPNCGGTKWISEFELNHLERQAFPPP